MRFYQTFFVIVLMHSMLFAADLNTTIIHGNSKLYHSLLQTLEKSLEADDESSLQKTLLIKLIQISDNNTTKKQEKITIPTDQKSYRELFSRYILDATEKAAAKKILETNSKKAEITAQQIRESNSTTLTMQLFYTLYDREKEEAQKKLTSLESELNHIAGTLTDSLARLSFDDNKIQKSKETLSREITYLGEQIKKLHIKEERYLLLNQKEQVEAIEKKIRILKHERHMLYKRELALNFLEFSHSLQEKDKKAFTYHQSILQAVKAHLDASEDLQEDINRLLNQMETTYLGTMETIKGKSVQGFKTEIKKLWEVANKPFFHVNKTPISIIKLLFALLIFSAGMLLSSLYRRNIKKLLKRNRSLTDSTRTLIANMGYYLIFVITFFVVLNALGIDLSSLALVAGALSVGIGFGLQNIISNFVSGIILMVERSIKIGDYVQLDEKLMGHVVDIKMRSITVNTNANIDVIVPNQDLIQNRVVNWTMNDKIRRFEIPFDVAYGTDPKKVIDVVEKAVRQSNFKDIYISEGEYTQVIMTEMGSSSVNFELFVWLQGKSILYTRRTTSRFLILIYNALYENNIEIPFPQQDLHIRSVDAEFPVVIRNSEQTAGSIDIHSSK